MGIKAYIAGCAGPQLTPKEKSFFSQDEPWGFILFARNIEDPDQVRALTDSLREITGRGDTPILIDQEGGRVRRLRPPNWPDYPPGQALGEIYGRSAEAGLRAAWLHARLMAADLYALGINVDCLPILDVPQADVHDVIGDRAYSPHPYEIVQIGRAVTDGLLAGGVLPIMKHIPGHGRAVADSHLELPVVDTHPAILGCTDIYPFMQLADLPMAMTAHIIYSGFDAGHPATQSQQVIERIVRGWIGFDGLLMSDDLSMQALSGDYAQRALSSFGAGCDIVLHCNGKMEEMSAIASVAPQLTGKSEHRARKALDWLKAPDENDLKALRAEFDELAMQAA